MNTKIILAIATILAFVGSVSAEEFDALINDSTRAFTRQKKSPEKLFYGKLSLDSQGNVVKTFYKEGVVTKATKVMMGSFDEKKKKWMPGEKVEGGVDADMFKEAGKVLQVRVTLNDNDKTTIERILVKNTDAPITMADPEFDAVLKQIGPQTNGRGTIWYTRLDVNEKGNVVKTFPLSSGLVTSDTKVAMGVYNEKEKKWEAGEAIANGLYGDVFLNIETKIVPVRITFREDRKGISQILVRPAGDKGKKR